MEIKMKKYIIAAAIMIGSTIAAQAQTTGYICNDNTFLSNVRSGPSAQNYPVIDKIGNNYRVLILDTTQNASGFIWAKIRYDSMRYGRPTVESGRIDGGNVCYY